MASMGPPFFGGGNLALFACDSGTCTGLQWGRRFLTAETEDLLFGVSQRGGLQWGRRFLTAETTLEPPRHSSLIRFNGAAVF